MNGTAEQHQHPKNFARTLRERGLPDAPPADNPAELAGAQWNKLHNYATKVAEIAAEISDENKSLLAQNESLTREVDRLTALNADIAREHRTTIAFAQALRTRFAAIREAFEAAEREALTYASQDVCEKKPPTPEEQREVEKVISDIARINVRVETDQHRTTPPSLSWPAGDVSRLSQVLARSPAT